MADIASGSPLSRGPSTHVNNQRKPSAPQTQQKHNDRNRKKHNQVDGAVSDGAVATAMLTPHSRKAQKSRQQNINVGARPTQQHGSAVISSAQKPRPVSAGGGLSPDTCAKSHEQAYAGPTFSNSPAASSLPVPKFFSRSVPIVARSPPTHVRPASERLSAEPQSSPESGAASPAPVPEPPLSPLDLFFKADRAEKEKSRNLSKSLSPGVARATPMMNANTSTPKSSKSGKGIFLDELDGDNTYVPSPRVMSSNRRPAPGERAYSSPNVASRVSRSGEEWSANTRSLKELLFNTAANASTTPPQSRSGLNPGSQTPEGVFGPLSPSFSGSGPSTPQPSSEQQSHYSLHYGNQNLSPLFKASRVDTPSRPSGLRQEFPNVTATGANSFPGSQGPPSYPSTVDHSTFARTYLKDQIRAYAPAEMPQFLFPSAPKDVHASGNVPEHGAMHVPVQPAHQQHGMPALTASSTAPRTGSRDVQTMENDLRRILKLNV